MKSLNQIKAKLEELQQKHLQLNSFYFGELYDLTNTEINYPLMSATLMDGSITKGEYRNRIMLLFADLVNKGEENRTDVLSDMQLVALDIHAQLYQWGTEEGIEISTDANFYDFVDRFNDEVTGWVLEIELVQFYERDACAVPGVTSYLIDLLGDYVIQLNSTDRIIIK